MAPAADKAEMEKDIFFAKLEALSKSSDTEDETSNDVREILKKSKSMRAPAFFYGESTSKRMLPATTFKRLPGFQRNESAPAASATIVSKESNTTPSPSPVDLSSQPAMSSKENTPASSNPRPYPERRTVSNPSIASASLVLTHSAGIQSLLGKKRKKSNTDTSKGKKKARQETKFQLVPEEQQIFKGHTFYYIPPDDVAPNRKLQITKARQYGAIWSKTFTTDITHIIAEKSLTWKDVMAFLKIDSLPEEVILVSDKYTNDCLTNRYLLDPTHKQYSVKGYQELSKIENSNNASMVVDTSLEPQVGNKRSGKEAYGQRDQTPPRSREIEESVHDEVISGSLVDPPVQDDSRVSESVNFPRNVHHSPTQSGQPVDELDEMIKIAYGMKDVLLDDEEDDPEAEKPSSRNDSENSNTEDENPASRKKSQPRMAITRAKNSVFNQENFHCMKGGTGVNSASNPNNRTIEILLQMHEYYARTRDNWREMAYRKAVAALRRQFTKITTFEQARAIPTIGDRIAAKIEEIVLTNRLQRLENAILEPNDLILQMFMKIYGVGLSQGWKWVLQGYQTLEDLEAHAQLTSNQRLGIEHYDDLQQRMPREEVTALGEIVKTTLAIVDAKVQVIIGGSYRRGAATSGDIDCLLTKPGTKTSSDLRRYLDKLVAQLTEVGFLVAPLAVPSSKSSSSGSKWHGCCVLPASTDSPKPIWRRIDFLLVPETELGAALIYFTGDDIFNRSIRLLASHRECRLNQRGLYKDVLRGPGRMKMTEGELVEGADEKKIFEHLGVPWRPPEHRICH